MTELHRHLGEERFRVSIVCLTLCVILNGSLGIILFILPVEKIYICLSVDII